jgi:glutamate 5-kinase
MVTPPNHADDRGRAVLSAARRVVVKIGSRLLAEDPVGRISALAAEAATLRDRKIRCVIVSSGAIALGMKRLQLESRPTTMPQLQAAAAIGQGHLMQHYDRAFAEHGLAVGQMLLTHDDFGDRGRFLTARHTLGALVDYGAVPIINENDTVAIEEIKFGDNDQLAALVTNLVEAEALIILTDVAGLLDRSGALIPEVDDPDAFTKLAGGSEKGGVGTGGMASKLAAAKIARRFGTTTVIVSGREPNAIARVMAGEALGTLFKPSPQAQALGSRKHWIAYALKPMGSIVVDDGARRALVDNHRSLLPSGIQLVRGVFGPGALVSVVGSDGAEFARGLVGYSADEIERIRGRKAREIATVLGYRYVDEVIHRDDLVIL